MKDIRRKNICSLTMVSFALTVLIKLSEIMMKISKLSSEELIEEAIEKARKQILSQTVLIKGLTKRVKGLTKRVEELEDRAEYVDDDLDCIHRALEAA